MQVTITLQNIVWAITVVTGLFGIMWGIKGNGKARDQCIKETAKKDALIDNKLDTISSSLCDVRAEVKSINTLHIQVRELDIRVGNAQKTADTAHKRLDTHIEKEDRNE